MYRITQLFRIYKKKTARRINLIRGSILQNQINTYWFDSIPNFCDLLNKSLLKYYGFYPINTAKNDSDVLAIGSILDSLKEDFTGYILGSGLQYDHKKNLPLAKIMALRGDLTRNRLGVSESIVLGDPGLLADFLLPKRQKKQFQLGIIPHYVDKHDERILQLFLKNYGKILLIDVQQNPVQVIKEIDKCSHILSSSLHGLVVADSLGIPNGWIILSDKILGDGFKFHDYYSAMNITPESHELKGKESIEDLIRKTHNVSTAIPKIKADLNSTFLEFRSLFIQ